MRGGLDDALDKLARRDELRRRAAGEATGTLPVVQELVETIAAVVGRNPKLEVTVGVEGVGDPTLLHFFVADGTVQVAVDTSLASRVTDAEQPPEHADFDFDIEPDERVGPPAAHPHPSRADVGEQTHRIAYGDRYEPGPGYGNGDDRQRRYATPAGDTRESAFPTADTTGDNPYLSPFAQTLPPSVPPQTTRRIRPEQHPAPQDPSDERRTGAQHNTAEQTPERRSMPRPLAEPIPLKVDSEETEMAARRLAALLRDNPTLLREAPPD